MTTVALVFFVISALIIWGGLVAASVALSRKPEVDFYPEGGEDHAESGAAG